MDDECWGVGIALNNRGRWMQDWMGGVSTDSVFEVIFSGILLKKETWMDESFKVRSITCIWIVGRVKICFMMTHDEIQSNVAAERHSL